MDKGAEKLRKLVADGISSVRRQRGMTQEEFVEVSGVPLSTLTKLESYVFWPSDKLLAKIFSALNTTLREVVGADFNEIPKAHHPEVMDQIKALKQALTLVEASVDQKVFREMERRARQNEPLVRAYRALEDHLGSELIESLKHATKEDLELVKATLPKRARGVKTRGGI